MKRNRVRFDTLALAFLAAALLIISTSLSGFQDNLKMLDHQVKQFQRVKRVFYSGQLLFLQQKFDKAEKKLLKCLEIFPGLANAEYYLGQIYYSRKDYQKAKKFLGMAIQHYRSVVNLQNAAHQQYLITLRRQRDELIAYLSSDSAKISAYQRTHAENRIARINQRLKTPITIPVDTIAPANYHWHMGNTHLKLKEYNEAEKQYLLGIKTDSKYTNCYNNLINLYYVFKKYPRAMAVIKQAQANEVKVNEKLVAAVQKAAGN